MIRLPSKLLEPSICRKYHCPFASASISCSDLLVACARRFREPALDSPRSFWLGRSKLDAGTALGGVARAEAEGHEHAATEQVVRGQLEPLHAQEGQVAREHQHGEDEEGQLAVHERERPWVHEHHGDDHADRRGPGDQAARRERRAMPARLSRRQGYGHDDRDAEVD